MLEYPTKIDNVSVEPAAEYNNLTSEMKTMLTSLGIAFNSGSIIQLAQAVATYSVIGSYFTDGGTPNTYVLTQAPATRKFSPTYYAGMEFYFYPANTNTGPSTANLAGLGVKTILQKDGVSALVGGELVANELARLVYDGVNLRVETLIIPDATTTIKGIASFNGSDFNVVAGAVSLLAGVSATSWTFDSGWTVTNAVALLTFIHGISLSFPADIVDILIFWRLNSGGSYISPVFYDNDHGAGSAGPLVSYDGTNIYLKTGGQTSYGSYVDSSGVTQTRGAGEVRVLAKKVA